MDDLKYQLRLTLNDEFAKTARNDPGNPTIAALTAILKRHDAVLKCQHDAFAGYVREAEANGIEKYPLYEWTKQTVDDPVKEAKYIKSFTLYVGGDEVYAKDKAEALKSPQLVATPKPSPRETSVTVWPSLMSTPPCRHSVTSMATTARAEPSQNSCPSVFS